MKIYCVQCKNYTNHKVEKELSQDFNPDNEPEMQIDFASGKWQILQCLGCDEITFREYWETSEDWNPATDKFEGTEKLYPPRSNNYLSTKPLYQMSSTLRTLYREIIDAYNNNINTLCAIGIRTVLEAICADKGIKSGLIEKKDKKGLIKRVRKNNLEGKIEGMHQKALLTKEHSSILHNIRFLGNEAAHEFANPSKDELKVAIEIIEHTLENIYELKDKMVNLQFKKRLRKK